MEKISVKLQVLSIPLAGDAGKFVVFFPENQEETIEESLKVPAYLKNYI